MQDLYHQQYRLGRESLGGFCQQLMSARASRALKKQQRRSGGSWWYFVFVVQC